MPFGQYPISFMKALATPIHKAWTKHLLLIIAFLSVFFLGYFCLSLLNNVHSVPAYPQPSLALILFSFFTATILAWFGSRVVCIAFFTPAASIFSILTSWVTQSPGYLFFIPTQIALCFLLFYLDQKKDAEIVAHDVEIEGATNEKNDIELAFKEEGTSISVFFEKYASYYNLRNLATDFSITLSLKELGQLIVSKTLELIVQGNWCLLFLAEPNSGSLSLVASKSLEGDARKKTKEGDLLDFWVLRNRQSLIVMDTQRDFRFDLQKTSALGDIRSVIASPLIHEGKVVGTLRLNSPKPGAFTTDDLRLLDAISTLASSAISNSILFQKTEELAIRDSLTGLYVQRYFLERLAEEHRRSLLMKTPLTFLMCDLDHFKSCNDRYGHGVGDYVLTKTSEVMLEKASEGIVARYGGEEFAILLPKVNFEKGKVLADSIRTALAEMGLTIRREVITITISIGVASIPIDTLDPEELIQIADRRLYQAKNNGRNQVCGGG